MAVGVVRASFHEAGRYIESGLWMNFAWICIAFGVFVGAIIVSYFVKYLVIAAFLCVNPRRQRRGATIPQHSAYWSGVHLVAILLQLLILLFGTLAAFTVAGVNFFTTAASLGLVALVFAYAAQAPLTNTFGGLIIFLTDKVEIGDYVVIKLYGMEGQIRAIYTMFAELETPDGHSIQVPNIMFLQTPIQLNRNGMPTTTNGGGNTIILPGTNHGLFSKAH